MPEPLTTDQVLILAAHATDSERQHSPPILIADTRLHILAMEAKLAKVDVPIADEATRCLQGRRLLQIATVALRAMGSLKLPWSMPLTPPRPDPSPSAN